MLRHLFGFLLAAAILVEGNLQAEDVQQKFLPSGVTKRVGGYRPIRAEMDRDADLVKTAPEGLEAPKFGTIVVDDRSWAFIVDEPDGQPAKLFVDTNGDGDLTNDPKTKWDVRKQGELTTYSGSGQIDLGDGNVGTLGLYRFDPKDERRPQLKNTLMFYLDYGYEFAFQLDGLEFSTFVAGNLSKDQRLPMDRDGNGEISRNFETAALGKPFNFTGSTYILSLSGGKLALDKATEELPRMPLPPDLAIGKRALEFTATTMDGTEMEFPKHYAGKIVMLDFWATWCGPCIAEIPNMKKAYADWHDLGYEILGISFDRADAEDKIKEFQEKHEISWNQIYEGKYWDTSLGKLHDVSGIPFVLLVDGDSGEILATERQLRGPGLSALIGQRLLKKTVGAASDTPEYWERAIVYWQRAVERQSDLAQSAFTSFAQAGRWSDAARFALKVVEQDPADSFVWLNVAPALVLGGDEAAYRDFCSRLVKHFADTQDARASAHTCKACLLRPSAVDYADLPEKAFLTELENGATASQQVAFRWGLKALLAYRRGDATGAVESLEKSTGFTASDFAQAQNQAIRALAEHQLGHLEEARSAMGQAEKVIDRLQRNANNQGHVDFAIAQILLREAQSAIGAK